MVLKKSGERSPLSHCTALPPQWRLLADASRVVLQVWALVDPFGRIKIQCLGLEGEKWGSPLPRAKIKKQGIQIYVLEPYKKKQRSSVVTDSFFHEHLQTEQCPQRSSPKSHGCIWGALFGAKAQTYGFGGNGPCHWEKTRIPWDSTRRRSQQLPLSRETGVYHLKLCCWAGSGLSSSKTGRGIPVGQKKETS